MATCKVAVATCSLGKSAAGHALFDKLEAASRAGFDGVEMAIECLEAHANTLTGVNDRAERLVLAARGAHSKAASLSLEIVTLMPFAAYDELKDPEAIESRLVEAELWLKLCHIMDVRIFQIPACTYPVTASEVTPDIEKIALNLRRLCQMAQPFNIQLAFEAPVWGLYVNRWQQTRDIATLVDMPNFGLCLDTYHIAAKEAGNPCNKDSPLRPDALTNLKSSLEELKQTLKPSQISYIQLSDASVADAEQKGYPMRDLDQPEFMTQSRNCRLFVAEPACYGGVLPALEVAKAIFETGYRGWVSMEAFNLDMWDNRSSVPDEWARRAMASWREVARQCGLNRGRDREIMGPRL